MYNLITTCVYMYTVTLAAMHIVQYCLLVIMLSSIQSTYKLYIIHVHVYMKIHVHSMLAIDVDKHTQQTKKTHKQPQWLH